MAIEKTIEIKVDAKNAISQVDSLNTKVKQTGDSAKKTKGGFKAMQSGIGLVGTAFKALGIGLIVAGFAKLAEMLQQNQSVIDKVNIASAVLG